MEWAGRVKLFIPRVPTCPPVQSFLLLLLAAGFLPVWIGSADPWWRVKEWMVLMAGMGWLACRPLWNLRAIRSGQDKWLSLFSLILLAHFFILFVFPIIRIPNKLFQVPWPWMAMFHAMVALAWLTDLRRCTRRQDIEHVLKGMAWLGVGLSAHMGLQAAGIDPLIWLVKSRFEGFKWLGENHVIGLMGNPFQASAALAVLIPAIAYQAFRGGKLWKTLLVLSFTASVLAQSASGFLAAVVGSVLASGRVRTIKTWTALIGCGLLSGLLVFFLKPDIFLDHGRLEIWKQAIPHILRHPFLGVGLNQFKLLNIQHVPNIAYDVRWAHNEWVHFAVELGIPAVLFLGFYLLSQARKLSRTHAGMFGCFVSILSLSFFHIPFHLAPVLAVAGICLVTSHLEPLKESHGNSQRN